MNKSIIEPVLLRQRLEKSVEVQNALLDLDIKEDECSGLKIFLDILRKWAFDGKHKSGKINLPILGKNLVYVLSSPNKTMVKLSAI